MMTVVVEVVDELGAIIHKDVRCGHGAVKKLRLPLSYRGFLGKRHEVFITIEIEEEA